MSLSLSLPINTTSRIEGQEKKVQKKSHEIRNKRKEKHLLRDTLSLRESIFCDTQSTRERLELHCKFTL